MAGGDRSKPFLGGRYRVREDDGHYSVSIDVPGVPREDLSVTLESDHTLHVRGSRKSTDGERAETGSFRYRWELGPNADAEQLAATLEDGVLTLTAPKRDPCVRVVEVATPGAPQPQKAEGQDRAGETAPNEEPTDAIVPPSS